MKQKTITKVSETKSWFFEKINKIDKLKNFYPMVREKERIYKLSTSIIRVVTSLKIIQLLTR